MALWTQRDGNGYRRGRAVVGWCPIRSGLGREQVRAGSVERPVLGEQAEVKENPKSAPGRFACRRAPAAATSGGGAGDRAGAARGKTAIRPDRETGRAGRDASAAAALGLPAGAAR